MTSGNTREQDLRHEQFLPQFHLLEGEKMKKDDAGGIGNFCEVLLTSDMRRGRAPTPPLSTSSVILHTAHVNLCLQSTKLHEVIRDITKLPCSLLQPCPVYQMRTCSYEKI